MSATTPVELVGRFETTDLPAHDRDVAGTSAPRSTRHRAGSAAACRRVLCHDGSDRDHRLRSLLVANHWDTIAAATDRLVVGACAGTHIESSDAEAEVSA